jgi:GNAT superfamily N-acetyltransferase
MPRRTAPRWQEPLTAIDTPPRVDIELLEQRLDEHNIVHTGISDARPLAILVRDDTDAIIAGLYGWTWGACCEVKTLWIAEQWRGRGFGTRLMLAAECEALARGATQMVLSTHSFQAPAFYERRGFVEIGRVKDYPVGHSNIYLRKTLAPEANDGAPAVTPPAPSAAPLKAGASSSRAPADSATEPYSR